MNEDDMDPSLGLAAYRAESVYSCRQSLGIAHRSESIATSPHPRKPAQGARTSGLFCAGRDPRQDGRIRPLSHFEGFKGGNLGDPFIDRGPGGLWRFALELYDQGYSSAHPNLSPPLFDFIDLATKSSINNVEFLQIRDSTSHS